MPVDQIDQCAHVHVCLCACILLESVIWQGNGWSNRLEHGGVPDVLQAQGLLP